MCTRKVLAAALSVLLTTSIFGALPSTWRATYAPTNSDLKAIASGAGQIVAVGESRTIITSSDGLNWTQAPIGGVDGFQAITYGNGKFVAGGHDSAFLATSADGINWSSQSTVGPEQIEGLAFGSGRFVAVGQYVGRDSFVITSQNGTLWGYPVRPTTNFLHAITYANGTFVAVGHLGTIITSPDGLTWTLRSSGTQNHLRAVTYTGASFVAGGDAAVVIASTDGISWSSAAPPSFEVKGFGSGNGAVVAVGNYQSDGRLHTSSDGIVWPGNAILTPQVLNAVAYLNGRFIAVGNSGLIFQSDLDTTGMINSWIKPTSGNWEDSYWSLGELPSAKHRQIQLYNTGWKAVAIGSATTANYPDSLRINSLFVDAPADSANLLLLNYAGLSVPLVVSNDFIIGQRGSLISYYSALRGGGLFINGSATFGEIGEAQFDLVYVGSTMPGQLSLSNSLFSARQLVVASGATTSTVNQEAGSNRFESLLIINNGVYNVKGGTLQIAGPQSLYAIVAPGRDGGLAQLNISGGTANLSAGVILGNQPVSYSNSVGSLSLSSGELTAPYIASYNGKVTQTGGRSFIDALLLAAHDGETGIYDLRGGSLETGPITVGTTNGSSAGRFYQAGGFHTNSGMGIFGYADWGLAAYNGLYWLYGGTLITPSITVRSGQFTHEGGTNRAGRISITRDGLYYLSAGKLNTTNVTVQFSASPWTSPAFVQTGGEHTVTNLFLDSRGLYDLQGGRLNAGSVSVEAGGELRLGSHGIISSNTTVFTHGGGRLVVDGYHQLGALLTSGDAHIDFGTGSSILRFTQSGNTGGALDAAIYITNWSGSTVSPGRDQLYVGTNDQAITPYQLELIYFINPPSYAPGTYGARVKPTGEIVPLDPPVISYQRYTNNWLLTWPQGYQIYSSTNVTGPYYPIYNATSPRNISFTDPRRFFLLYPH